MHPRMHQPTVRIFGGRGDGETGLGLRVAVLVVLGLRLGGTAMIGRLMMTAPPLVNRNYTTRVTHKG